MAFLVARYGNEKFERVTAGEVAAMHYVYDHDKPSARVLYLVPQLGEEVTPTIPWGEQDIDSGATTSQALVPGIRPDLPVIAKFRTSPPQHLPDRHPGTGRLPAAQPRLPGGLGRRGSAPPWTPPRSSNGSSPTNDAAVYTMKSFPEGPRAAQPPGHDPPDATTAWTPFGLVGLAVSWIALFVYELLRLRGPGHARRGRRRMLVTGGIAFVIAVGVIIERFLVIGFL